jgi:3-isopropylmalate/(R)-2-methylmalate dehydratase large subunit
MAHTIIEKIFLANGAEAAEPGSIQWLGLDYRTARDFGGPAGQDLLSRAGIWSRTPSARSSLDCNVPANPLRRQPADSPRVRPRARAKVYDVDAGIGSHVLIEQGLVKPGTTVPAPTATTTSPRALSARMGDSISPTPSPTVYLRGAANGADHA